MIKAVRDRLIITLVEMKRYLRVDHNYDDEFLTDLIDIAKEQADLYLQNEFEEEDPEGNVTTVDVPFSVKLACFKMVASWYETKLDDRVSESIGGYTYELGEIPWSSKKLLHPLRKLVGT